MNTLIKQERTTLKQSLTLVATNIDFRSIAGGPDVFVVTSSTRQK